MSLLNVWREGRPRRKRSGLLVGEGYAQGKVSELGMKESEATLTQQMQIGLHPKGSDGNCSCSCTDLYSKNYWIVY